MGTNWKAAYTALYKVYAEDAYSNLAINEALRDSDVSSQGFVRVMTKGVIRDTILIDANINRFADNGIKSIKKRPLIILRMGFFAIARMNSVPPYAAVNEAVSLAGKMTPGEKEFINAVLRAFVRDGGNLVISSTDDKLKEISCRYSFPYHLVRFLSKQYGSADIEKIIKGLYDIPELNIRRNSNACGRGDLLKSLHDRGIVAFVNELTQNGIIVEDGQVVSTPEYMRGMFSIQSTSSLRSIESFNPESGDKVLDLCAAPGGKTAAMAEMMNDEGVIIATDIHEHRIRLINDTAARLGLGCIDAEVADAAVYRSDFDEYFDKVLADVPCSGLGVIAGKPELKLRVDLDELPELYKLQYQILENAYRYLKPGGTLMYSTCTINKKENEQIVAKLCDSFEKARVIEYNSILPYNKQVGFYYCKIQK